MSLDAVLEQINQQGASQMNAILADAELEAVHIVQQAAAESADIRNHAGQEGKTRGLQERAAVMQQAQLDALIKIGKIRSAIVEEAIGEARQQLDLVRKKPSYPDLLHRLTLEAVHEISGSTSQDDPIRLLADPRDKNILLPLITEITHPVEVHFDLDCQGGVIAETSDRQVIVYNTLETRLERALPFLHESLAGYFESLLNTA